MSANFNLHIEGVVGKITVFQRTTETGGYAIIKDATSTANSAIYDMDFVGEIYPKFIKLVCATEPTMAEVTSEGEVIQIETPVEPEEPEEPEGGYELEYAFEIPMIDESDMALEPYWSGRIDGDFSEFYDKVETVTKKYGEELSDGQWELRDKDLVLEKTNITVNGFRVEGFYIYGGFIDMMTDGPMGGQSQSTAVITKEGIEFASPLPYKPEIEYHFEIPMEESEHIYNGYEGYLSGDYTETLNTLVAFVKKHGESEYDGYWKLPEDIVSKKVKITVNNDVVTGMEYYEDENAVSMNTGMSMSLFRLSPNMISYEKYPEF